jgi:hypothetical protein
MARVLVVKHEFGGRAKGDRITDAAEIAEILAGEQAHHVLQSDHPDHALQGESAE